jgi:hypothetical protein
MKKNIGTADRIVRILIGVAIAGAGVYYRSWWGLVALVPFVTAATGTCWLWSLLGINTCKEGSCEPATRTESVPPVHPDQPAQ